MARLRAIMWINLAAMFLLVIAIAVPHWSHGTAENGREPNIPNVRGDVYLGLWQGCADIEDRYIMRPLGRTGGRDCRIGHCIESAFFTYSTRQLSVDLCAKSKVSAAFALMVLGLFLCAFYQTSVRSYFGWQQSHGWAMVCQFVAVIFSIVSWATWTSWQTEFNDQETASTATTRIDELKLGTGPVFLMIVMILAAINTWLEKDAYNDEQAEDIRRSAARMSQLEKRERLVQDDPERMVVNPEYGDSEAATSKGPPPVRPAVRPRSGASQA